MASGQISDCRVVEEDDKNANKNWKIKNRKRHDGHGIDNERGVSYCIGDSLSDVGRRSSNTCSSRSHDAVNESKDETSHWTFEGSNEPRLGNNEHGMRATSLSTVGTAAATTSASTILVSLPFPLKMVLEMVVVS